MLVMFLGRTFKEFVFKLSGNLVSVDCLFFVSGCNILGKFYYVPSFMEDILDEVRLFLAVCV